MADTKKKPAAKKEPRTFYLGTGRRKTAVARVRITEGKGQIVINGKPFDEYFHEDKDRAAVTGPLKVTDQINRLDVFVNAKGGGLSGQAGAIRHGITRALMELNPEFRPVLKKAGFVTRDARAVERKKYGRPGARKRFQFSKR